MAACSTARPPAIGNRLGGDPGQSGADSRYGSQDGRLDGAAQRSQFRSKVGDIVYFSSDATDLTSAAQDTLAKQARWLADHPNQTVAIEGHADERGTREYNIALGAKRATSVKSYLISHGVQASRIRTVSYGKERPVATCDDITCWSRNRRAQTTLGAMAVSQASSGSTSGDRKRRW